jgi:hypothetical protein
MKKIQNKIVFLISSPRSGSSMMRNKLNDFNDIIALPSDMRIVEFCFRNSKLFYSDQIAFKDLLVQHYSTGTLAMLSQEDWEVLKNKELGDFYDLIDCLFRMFANHISKSINDNTFFLEKSPNNMYYFTFLKDHFKDSSIVYLIRDARDVVASLNAKSWSSHNTLYNAKRWKVEQELMRGNYDICIQYEHLVEDTKSTLTHLLMKLGYSAIEEVDTLMKIDNAKSKSTPETDKAVHSGNKHKFLKTLSSIEREQEIIESVCGKIMIEFGYVSFATNFDHRYFRKRFFFSLEHRLNRLIKFFKGEEEY